MPNKYREGTATLYLRMPEILKKRLFEVAENLDRPATDLARKAIEKFLAEVEKEKIFEKPVDR